MTLFLTRYFLRELSGWVLFTPLALSFIFLFGIGMPSFVIFLFVINCCTIVFLKYSELRKNYLTTLTLAPVPLKTKIHVDLAFFSWVSFCYFIYALLASTSLTLLIDQQFVLPSLPQLCFLIGSYLILITINSWLLAQNRVPVSILLIMVLSIPLFINITAVITFVSMYGVHFLIFSVGIATISYVSLATFYNKGVLR